MNPKKFSSVFVLFLIISSLTVVNSCGERDGTVSCFPNSVISVTLDLTLPKYYTLQKIPKTIKQTNYAPASHCTRMRQTAVQQP